MELDILAGTVLVIRGDELLTSDSVVGDGDVVELRPVMSGRRRSREVPEVRRRGGPRAEAAQCRVLPRALHRVLQEAGRRGGPQAPDVHAGRDRDGGGVGGQGFARALGRPHRGGVPHRRASTSISGSSSTPSSRKPSARRSRPRAGRPCTSSGWRRPWARAFPQVQKVTRRPTCSACGLGKRYLMNKAALDHGYPVVATGHNLDDEAATLFGSVMHWQTDALPRQSPALASTHPKLVRRVKPLYRLSERETAGLRVPARDRLHRRGVPVRRGRDVDRPQGGAEPARGDVAGRQAQLPLRVPREGAPGVRARGERRAPRVRVLRPGHDRDALRVLQARRSGQARGRGAGSSTPRRGGREGA